MITYAQLRRACVNEDEWTLPFKYTCNQSVCMKNILSDNRVGTFRWPLVHGLPRWTRSMDYLNGLPMDYPIWTTLKFVANMNLTMLEPEQKMWLINNHLRCNRFNPQLDLCHKTLEEKTSGLRGRIPASCPFATCVRVVGVQVRDTCKCDYTCKIFTYEACLRG